MKQIFESLNKSLVMKGIQCERYLYLQRYQPALAKKPSIELLHRLQEGTAIGELARKRFSGGVLIPSGKDVDTDFAIDRTAAALSDPKTKVIYEATFRHQGVLVQVDVLRRLGRKAWEIIEVKSSTKIKNHYFWDLAVQAWVVSGAGITIHYAQLMYVNNESNSASPAKLFKLKDVTREVADHLPHVGGKVNELKQVLQLKTAPAVRLSENCSKPHQCPFFDTCWSEIPKPNVFYLPYIGMRAWKFYDEGKVSLYDIEEDLLTPTQKLMVQAVKSKKRLVSPDVIDDWVQDLKYPLTFLDFETVAYAIPRFGAKPYEQIPVQYSIQVQHEPAAQTVRFDYLHSDETDPRKCLAKSLVNSAPAQGTVIAYNASFERRILLSLADAVPSLKRQLVSISRRLKDPLPVIRASIMDPNFNGSYSIKSVAPALLGKGYDDLEIADGSTAQIKFLEMLKSTGSHRLRLRDELIQYCQRDTDLMVGIVEFLSSLTRDEA